MSRKKIVKRDGKPAAIVPEESPVAREPEALPAVEVRLVKPNIIGGDDISLYGLSGVVVQWKDVTEHTVLGSFCVAGFENKSVQITGQLGGGSFDLCGKNDPCGKEYSQLTDSAGEPLTAVGKGRMRSVSSHCYYFKPVRNGGKGMKVDITVILYNSK